MFSGQIIASFVEANAASSPGVEQKVSSLAQLKVKGVVLGPIHVAPSDDPMNVRFEEISPDVGNLEQFRGLIQAAQRNGERVENVAQTNQFPDVM